MWPSVVLLPVLVSVSIGESKPKNIYLVCGATAMTQCIHYLPWEFIPQSQAIPS